MANEDFRRIVESLKVAIAIVDPKGAIRYANAATEELLGAEESALLGKPLADFFGARERKRLAQNVTRVADGKAANAFLDAQAGAAVGRWVQVSLQPLPDAAEKSDGVLVVLNDIGAQRDTDAALGRSEARLLALTEASPVAAMVEDDEGDILVANEAFCRLLGLEGAPGSMPGLAARDVLAKAGATAKALERRPVSLDDREVGAVWIAQATGVQTPERNAAEIALIQKIGEELSIALEGIAAISIRAQQTEADPALLDAVQQIRDSTETAMNAIGDLVDFSRISGGAVVLRKSVFSLREALSDLIARVVPNAEEHGCRLRLKVEQDVSDRLEGDVGRLQLTLKNLLDNAFAIAAGAEVTLQITPEYMTETGIQLSFSVTAVHETGTISRSAEAGMGVAVARFMVAAMGGKLAVAARPADDALYAFTIEFPVHAALPPPPRVSYVSLVGMPVMVVSREPEQRLALSNLLRGWRMVPLEADNGAMAMALLERMHEEGTPVPLVVLSNRLGTQNGFLLAFRIKHHRKLGSTLIMMLASQGKAGDAIACRENGISAYMRYPIADRQLNEAIIAVTGAAVDADETPTLVTRHSLREQRKGATVLLMDSGRDSQILAAHILGRHDCSVVVAQDLPEALAALDQDVYDLVLVETSLPGLDVGSAAQTLRSHITRDPDGTKIVAVSATQDGSYRETMLMQGFDGTIPKPFRKEDLLALLKSVGRLAEAS
jgi:PAS domain S-box-containing protein